MENVLTDPDQVLALAGLTMPEGATGTVVGVDNETTAINKSLYCYIVTLTAPRESFEEWTNTTGNSVYAELGSWRREPSQDPFGLAAVTGVTGAPPEESRRSTQLQFDPGVAGHVGILEIYLLGPDQTNAFVLVYTGRKANIDDFRNGLSSRG